MTIESKGIELNQAIAKNIDNIPLQAKNFILNGICFYSTIMFLVYGLYYYFELEFYQAAFINFSMSSFLIGVCLFYKLTKLYIISVHIIILSCFIALLFINFFLGAHQSPNLYWFLVVLGAAGFLVSLKAFLVWTLVVMFSIFFLYRISYSELNQYIYKLSPEQYQILHMTSFVGISLFFAFYYFIYSNGISKLILKIDNKRIEVQTMLRILEHDIANPLNVASLAVERLYKKNPEDRMLGMIYKSLKTIGSILKSARTFDQIDSGKQDLAVETANIEHVLIGAIEQVKDDTQKKEITINADLININVKGNSLILVNQVFVNLLTNAIKFSPKKACIDIRCEKNEKNIEINIIDYGVGIPSHLLTKIFRADVKTTRRGTAGEIGTGFGLPIVKTCLKKFDGDICVKLNNEEGKNLQSLP